MNFEERLLKLCLKHNLTLGLAESCTGGAFAARITQISGASQYFAGSIVSYQNEVKTKILGVSDALIKEKGAVSNEVTEEMLNGALKLFDTDLAVAITGIAGPLGGTPKTPVGTLTIAFGGKKVLSEVQNFKVFGSRNIIIQKAIDIGLAQLIKIIEKHY